MDDVIHPDAMPGLFSLRWRTDPAGSLYRGYRLFDTLYPGLAKTHPYTDERAEKKKSRKERKKAKKLRGELIEANRRGGRASKKLK